ncbi:MAG: DTW domain-containing protein [Inhella sp.]|uniref:tRNA-uridine aminocarboxypropyltransferase n=1 Tax=Inhella sp. TaxID=1921806 RepID=UPI0022BEA061|nr:tRNA-uridine aminocarboxypropyltransferase [Inhella sp.]MCZ8236778.1 DTW domain-containing protein [Inhella sp.]
MTLPGEAPARWRRRCTRCLRARCLCHCVPRPALAHPTEVVILQHPLEQGEVKGTARLLTLSLATCQLHVGEDFAPLPNPEGRVEALLYPGDSATPLPEGTPPGRLRLYVLDGTWRKSRLLLHRNPWLQALPRWPLGTVPPTRYRVRRAQSAHQLSTLEAVAYALPAPAPVGALLAVLEGLMAATEAATGCERRGP